MPGFGVNEDHSPTWLICVPNQNEVTATVTTMKAACDVRIIEQFYTATVGVKRGIKFGDAWRRA